MRGDGNQAGAGGDVEDVHAGLQAALAQDVAAIPGAGAEAGPAFGFVVAGGGLVEHFAGDAAAFLFAGKIGVEPGCGIEGSVAWFGLAAWPWFRTSRSARAAGRRSTKPMNSRVCIQVSSTLSRR